MMKGLRCIGCDIKQAENEPKKYLKSRKIKALQNNASTVFLWTVVGKEEQCACQNKYTEG